MEKKIALTQEENTKRLLFIGKCVDGNLTVPNYTKFGVVQPMTVQDMSNANIGTLEALYIAIQKSVNEQSLGLNAKPVLIAGISAQEWLDFIKLTVQNKEYNAYKKFLENKRDRIKLELDSMKTPSQKKKELQKELAELEA